MIDAAAHYLEVRQRSVAEVRRHLVSAGYREELVEQAVQRLLELGYLDDAAFARAWIESRDRAHPRGEVALRRELSAKGVDRGIAAEVLRERDEQESTAAGRVRPDSTAADDGGAAGDTDARADERAARRLLDGRRRSLERVPDPRIRRQRAYALLARNGFDPDVCRRIAAEVSDGAAPDEA